MTSGLPGCWGVCWHSCGSVGIPTRSAWLPLPCQPKSPAFPFFFMLKFNRWAWHSPWRSGYMPWCRFLRWLFSTLERSLTLEHHLELGWWISRVRWCFFFRETLYFNIFFSTCFHVSTNVSTFFSTNLWPWLQKTSPSWSPMWCTRSTPGRAGLSGPAMAMKMMHGTWTWRHGAKSLVSATY